MVEREGRDAPCRTADIPLGMSAGADDLDLPEGLSDDGLPDGALDQLAFRYGYAARNVLAVAAEHTELAVPIVVGRPDMVAEVVIAARLEQARSVADVLLRRTRLGILAAPQLRDGEGRARRSPPRSAASSAGTGAASSARPRHGSRRRGRRG